MPRLSLYRPEKGNDFKFIDKAVEEQFQIGGTDVFVHKYLGPIQPLDGTATPGVPIQDSLFPELEIQDLVFLENRDRRYDKDIFILRGIYTMQDLNFNLSQFGIFLNNDTILLHFHLRSSVETLSRKIMAGDVIELPHLKDEYALDDSLVALKRFYVVEEVVRAASGFSQTWYPHILKCKCTPIVDSQEYAQIMNQDSGNGDGSTIGDLLSTYSQTLSINKAIIQEAELNTPLSGYDTTKFYVVNTTNLDGYILQDASNINLDASLDSTNLDGHIVDASFTLRSPDKEMYLGYMAQDDGIPPNGIPYTFGISFPTNELVKGQFHLRTDYLPNRLFRYNGRYWEKFEDSIRMTLTNSYHKNLPSYDVNTSTYSTEIRETQRFSFINNNQTTTVAGETFPERQALSQILKPKADN